MSDLTLSPRELVEITGYRRPTEQLEELHAQGFWRARRSPTTGDIILERAHYDAVCSGERARTKARKAPEVVMLRSA